jgi:phosphoribosylanthranilate isomerase
VKICGITSLEQALSAVEAGADMLGFNFYPPSPRYISPQVCADIIGELIQSGSKITTVGVFVNMPPVEVKKIMRACGLDLAQLAGDEPPEDLLALGDQAFKALRSTDICSLSQAMALYPSRRKAPSWLVDAHRPGEYGGTGQTADWSLAAQAARRAPILLAGGLTAANVAAAIAQVRPWGVDVASGVESAPGVKDEAKMRAFIRAVQASAPDRLEQD